MAVNSELQFQTYIVANGRRSGPYTETLTGGNLQGPTFTVAAGTTWTFYGSGFPTAKLIAYSLVTVTEPVTVSFNTTGSAVTVTVQPDAPQTWSASHSTNPIPTDCTGITVANPSTANATDVYLHILVST